MAQPSEANRFAPPTAHVDDVAPAGDAPVLAGRGVRLGALLIDMAIGMSLAWGLSKLTPLRLFEPSASFGLLARDVAVSLALFLAVHGWLLLRHGQTVGKRALGLRIAGLDGGAVSPGRLIGLRYALPYAVLLVPVAGSALMSLWGLVDGLMIFRANRRCLHDVIAGTQVVKV